MENPVARVDDYVEARRIAIETLADRPLDGLAEHAGYAVDGDSMVIPFLTRNYRLSHPAFELSDADDPAAEVPIQEQVLIFHYLQGASLNAPDGRMIAYREIPGAAFYYSAFVKRAIDPLKAVFGASPETMATGAAALAGVPVEMGDVGYEFTPFPRVPIHLGVWGADEEFGAEANVLFDSSVGRMLSPEDAAWLAGMVVYRLIAKSR